MEKLRNLLLYGGAMPDVYRNCRDEIRKENLEKLFFFLSVPTSLRWPVRWCCCARCRAARTATSSFPSVRTVLWASAIC